MTASRVRTRQGVGAKGAGQHLGCPGVHIDQAALQLVPVVQQRAAGGLVHRRHSRLQAAAAAPTALGGLAPAGPLLV